MLGMGAAIVDTDLPFDHWSAPVIFNAMAEALVYMIKQKWVKGLDHFLEDFYYW